jgi:hypothetical protein
VPTVRPMSQEPQDRMTEADFRRSRTLCHVAAAVRGFNFVVSATVVLYYTQTLRADEPKK